MAQKHQKLPPQVTLRWGLQQGRSVIPTSTKSHHNAEKLDVFDFRLSDDELASGCTGDRQAWGT